LSNASKGGYSKSERFDHFLYRKALNKENLGKKGSVKE
jgi:hypothetical protein